jgi:precorrin-2 dehydrogenase / sirohydrochlorin ferrochelatase
LQYYPIYLSITNKKCVVAGGGEVGERKVERLVACGAQVVLTSRELTPVLEKMKGEGRLEHIDTDYDESCLAGAFLVIGATDKSEINARIYRDAKERNILVNIADDPTKCDFILPALLERGDLVVALSTGGKSPALAVKLREDLEALFGPEYETFLEIMGKVRAMLLATQRSSEDNKKVFTALVESDVLRLIKEKNWEEARRRIHDIAGLDVDVSGDGNTMGKR